MTIAVPAGSTQQFNARLSGGSTTVTWEVNGVAGGDPSDGTISSSGMYTAPTQVPTSEPVIVTAIAGKASATAKLNVIYSDVTLRGRYLADLYEHSSSNNSTTLLGYVSFDGAGTVSGNVDVNSTATGGATYVGVTGQYTVNTDGSGTLTLNAGSAGTFTLNLYMAEAGLVAVTDATAGKLGGSLWGPPMSAQSSTVPAGRYVVTYSGISPKGTDIEALASVAIQSSGQVAEMELDEHDSGSNPINASALPNGSYSMAASGRGTFSFTDAGGTLHNFAMYAGPGNSYELMSLDSGMPLRGTLDPQTGNGLPTSGTGVMAAGQDDFDGSNNPDVMLAQVDFSDDQFQGLQNDNGTMTTISGRASLYPADSNQRGEIDIVVSGIFRQFAFYVESPYQIDLLEIDSQGNLAGHMGLVSSSVSIMPGTYTILDDYYGANSQAPNLVSGILRIAPNGQITGSEALNTGSSITALSVTGSLAVSSTGNLFMILNFSNGTTQHLDVLGASSDYLLLMNTDANAIGSGGVILQFY